MQQRIADCEMLRYAADGHCDTCELFGFRSLSFGLVLEQAHLANHPSTLVRFHENVKVC